MLRVAAGALQCLGAHGWRRSNPVVIDGRAYRWTKSFRGDGLSHQSAFTTYSVPWVHSR